MGTFSAKIKNKKIPQRKRNVDIFWCNMWRIYNTTKSTLAREKEKGLSLENF